LNGAGDPKLRQTAGAQRIAAPAYGVLALGSAEANAEEVAVLRRSLGPAGQPPFPTSLLKAAEEQTVVALAAVVRALAQGGAAGQNWEEWGVVAAPRSLGRLAAAEALYKFHHGGVGKISPFVVPHHSLHALSGTISQAFRMYGPNLGVGGHAGAIWEGLLTVLTLLAEGTVAGLWLVVSECDPEPVPAPAGGSLVPVRYRALALAFVPQPLPAALAQLRLLPHSAAAPASMPPSVADLTGFLAGAGLPYRRWSLGWGACLELRRFPAAAGWLHEAARQVA
jgi:hypothetical protein